MEAAEVSPVFQACCLSWKASKRTNQVVPAGLAPTTAPLKVSQNDFNALGEIGSLGRPNLTEKAMNDVSGGEQFGGTGHREISSREPTVPESLESTTENLSHPTSPGSKGALDIENRGASGSVKNAKRELDFGLTMSPSSLSRIHSEGAKEHEEESKLEGASYPKRQSGKQAPDGVKSRGPVTVCLHCAATTGALDTMWQYWQEAEQRARQAEATAGAMAKKERRLVSQLCSLLKQVELRQVQVDCLSGLVANQQADYRALEGRYLSHLSAEQGLEEERGTDASHNAVLSAGKQIESAETASKEPECQERERQESTMEGDATSRTEDTMPGGALASEVTASEKPSLEVAARVGVPSLNLGKQAEVWAVARTESRAESHVPSESLQSESSFEFDASPVAVQEAAKEESDRLVRASDRLKEASARLLEANKRRDSDTKTPTGLRAADMEISAPILSREHGAYSSLDGEKQSRTSDVGRPKLHEENQYAELLVEELSESTSSYETSPASDTNEREARRSSFDEQKVAERKGGSQLGDFEHEVLVEAFALEERVAFSERALEAHRQQTSQGLDSYASAWASDSPESDRPKAEHLAMAWGDNSVNVYPPGRETVSPLDSSSLPSPRVVRPPRNASASHVTQQSDAARLLESRGKLTRRDSLPRRREGFAVFGGSPEAEKGLVPHPPASAAPRRKASTRERQLAASAGRISDKENGPSHVPTISLRLQDLTAKLGGGDENTCKNYVKKESDYVKKENDSVKKESEMSAPEPPPQPRATVSRPQFRVLRPKVN